MRRNGYLLASGEWHRFVDPDYLMKDNSSAIWRPLLLIFALDKLKVRNISIPGVADLLT